MLKTYDEFIRKVDAIGFMALSNGFAEGFPTLGQLTDAAAWHTGDPNTDPWQWKDRAAAEKKLAFGCILGGHKGFVAKWIYPYFYAVCRPRSSMEKRYSIGEVNQTAYTLWKLFDERTELNTDEIRRLMGVSGKNGAGRVDAAVRELQRQYYITVSGNQRKRNKAGEEYGWPANKYMLVSQWAAQWLSAAEKISRDEAKEKILDIGQAAGSTVSTDELTKALFKK